jgi:hypothetical protein
VLASPNGYANEKYRIPTSMVDVIGKVNICFKGGSGDISKSSGINISDQLTKVKSVKDSFSSVTS